MVESSPSARVPRLLPRYFHQGRLLLHQLTNLHRPTRPARASSIGTEIRIGIFPTRLPLVRGGRTFPRYFTCGCATRIVINFFFFFFFNSHVERAADHPAASRLKVDRAIMTPRSASRRPMSTSEKSGASWPEGQVGKSDYSRIFSLRKHLSDHMPKNPARSILQSVRGQRKLSISPTYPPILASTRKNV